MISLSLPGCVVETTTVAGDTLLVDAHPAQATARCPDCQRPSSRVHSRSLRLPRDLPLAVYRVRLRLRVRRFFASLTAARGAPSLNRCRNSSPRRAQRTSRFTQSLHDLSLSLGGRPAARLAQRLRFSVSRSTCTRILRATPLPPVSTPKVLGVDDFCVSQRPGLRQHPRRPSRRSPDRPAARPEC